MVEGLNRQLFNQAREYIVGGVNSPVRAFKAVGGYPIFVGHARGSKIYGECGREFIDYCQSFGALILGHAHPEVVGKLKKIIEKGTSFGAPTKLETELAKLIIEAIPSIEKVRLTNSGTEAVMGAIRLARAFSKKEKIIKFAGSYHGHADYLLNCPGIPEDFRKYTIVLPYNNIIKVKETIKRYHKDIAAVIVEPVAANMGVVLAKEGFLETLRKITHSNNIVLIFDEVITGFRFTFGGVQKLFKINPDLTCLGKIIGGGLPVGAFGGRKEIMQLLAPEGDVYQAGTFSGNPAVVSAGIATLRILQEKNPYALLRRRTQEFSEQIKLMAKDYRLKIKINYTGSLFSIFFTDKNVTDYQTAKTQNTKVFKKFFHGLLKEGVYLSPCGFEANFISVAHTLKDLERTQKVASIVFSNLRRLGC